MEFLKHTEWPMWFGYAAVASSIVTCAMKTMIPLRVVSMTCNALFIVYGFFSGIYPTLILNLILLPLNTVRLWVRKKRTGSPAFCADDPVSQIRFAAPKQSGIA